jgi:hypothetical protein
MRIKELIWMVLAWSIAVNALTQTSELEMIQLSSVDSTGLPGDDFSLEGALELFQKATSPEQLEQWLNDENLHVSNLDLNEDGEVDYIRVLDQQIGNDHALILQVPLNSQESQDVAVIELSQLTPDSAIVQIVGDESLYGGEIIIEPSIEFESEFKKVKGPSLERFSLLRKCVNVWRWSCVQFIYRPAYKIWVSPYHWQYYPAYWKPWKRHHWHRHWWYCHQQHHYGAHYWRANAVRCAVMHAAYRNTRVYASSIEARNRKGNARLNGRSNVHHGEKGKNRIKKGERRAAHGASRSQAKGHKRKG